MYITITDIMDEKRIDLAYPIQGKEVAVVRVFSDNVQYWLKEPLKVLLKTGKEKKLLKVAYTDTDIELNVLIGLELKSQQSTPLRRTSWNTSWRWSSAWTSSTELTT